MSNATQAAPLTFDELTATDGQLKLYDSAVDALGEKIGEIVEAIVDPIYQNDLWDLIPEGALRITEDTRGENMGSDTREAIESWVQGLILAGDWRAIRTLAEGIDAALEDEDDEDQEDDDG